MKKKMGEVWKCKKGEVLKNEYNECEDINEWDKNGRC
jgi:hypothetical protein